MRDGLVEGTRERLEAGYWPRVHCLLLVTLANAAAFLVSVAMLAVDVESMAVRYGVAAIAGYLAFLLLIRAWVRWKWSNLVEDPALDPLDIAGTIGSISGVSAVNGTPVLGPALPFSWHSADYGRR